MNVGKTNAPLDFRAAAEGSMTDEKNVAPGKLGAEEIVQTHEEPQSKQLSASQKKANDLLEWESSPSITHVKKAVEEKTEEQTISSRPFNVEEIPRAYIDPLSNLKEEVEALLPSLDLEIGDCLGTGNFGEVYEARSLNGPQGNYDSVLKIEKNLTFIPASLKFWRIKGFGLSRIQLRNTVRPIAFLVSVRVAEAFKGKGVLEKWTQKFPLHAEESASYTNALLIPASQFKEFGHMMRQEFPEMEVALAAERMPKAPGENLRETIAKAEKPNGKKFLPTEKRFRDLLNGCFCFLEDAHFSNYVHLDLKPANILFDDASGQVTIIDYDSGYRGMSRYREDGSLKTMTKQGEQPSKKTNPRFFDQYHGSLPYMAPQVKSNNPEQGMIDQLLFRESYQSNVHAYSMALVLLESMGVMEHYNLANEEKNQNAPTGFMKWISRPKQPDNYLEFFLESDRPAVQKIAKKIKNEKEISELLQLTFEYSKSGNVEENFHHWQTAFHAFQKKYGYKERAELPNSVSSAPATPTIKNSLARARVRRLLGSWKS